MYIKLCDRCGRVTKNRVAFLLPNEPGTGCYQFDGVWFGNNGITLCNNCLDDFENFRTEHERFNNTFTLIYEREKEPENCVRT